MFVIDTNFLVHAADTHSVLHQPCHRLLYEWHSKRQPCFVTWGICYEFLRVSTHSVVFVSPFSAQEAWNFLDVLFFEKRLVLTPTERHSAVLAELFKEMPSLSGSVMHDAHTAVLMREHGLRQIYTFDAYFHRFPFLEVIDPLKPS